MDEHCGGITEQVGYDLDRRASFIFCNNEFVITEGGLLFQPMTLELSNGRLGGDLPASLKPGLCLSYGHCRHSSASGGGPGRRSKMSFHP